MWVHASCVSAYTDASLFLSPPLHRLCFPSPHSLSVGDQAVVVVTLVGVHEPGWWRGGGGGMTLFSRKSETVRTFLQRRFGWRPSCCSASTGWYRVYDICAWGLLDWMLWTNEEYSGGKTRRRNHQFAPVTVWSLRNPPESTGFIFTPSSVPFGVSLGANLRGNELTSPYQVVYICHVCLLLSKVHMESVCKIVWAPASCDEDEFTLNRRQRLMSGGLNLTSETCGGCCGNFPFKAACLFHRDYWQPIRNRIKRNSVRPFL